MANDEIPLHDVPEHFFDQEKWKEFIGHVGGRCP
jgi:hypothetical protein